MSIFLQQPRQSRPQRYSISLPFEIPKNGGFYPLNHPPYIPAFGAPALSQLRRSKESVRTHQAELTPTSSSFCLHFTNSFCEQMKWLRPKKKRSPCGRKKDILPQGKKFPCARREISVRTKNIFVRTKIYFLPQGNFTLCGRRLNPLHNKRLGRRHKNYLTPACL